MLEVFAIMLLCNTNRKNAIKRGKKPGGFVALTVLLWFGLEITGLVIGLAAEMEIGAYLLAFAFAAIGGLTSYLIAKNGKQGDYVSPSEKATAAVLSSAETLDMPAEIRIIRDRSMSGAFMDYPLTLNGQLLASVRNGESVTVQTNRKHNILCITDAYGTELKPFFFDIAAGGHAEIHFKSGRFMPKATAGTLPLSIPATESSGVNG